MLGGSQRNLLSLDLQKEEVSPARAPQIRSIVNSEFIKHKLPKDHEQLAVKITEIIEYCL